MLYRKSQDYNNIVLELLSIVPTKSANSLADVVNAAWEVYLDDGKWCELNCSEDEKNNILNELTIKSFEILEIRQRLSIQ